MVVRNALLLTSPGERQKAFPLQKFPLQLDRFKQQREICRSLLNYIEFYEQMYTFVCLMIKIDLKGLMAYFLFQTQMYEKYI